MIGRICSRLIGRKKRGHLDWSAKAEEGSPCKCGHRLEAALSCERLRLWFHWRPLAVLTISSSSSRRI